MKSIKTKILLCLMFFLLYSSSFICADVTFPGPSGYIHVPSATTMKNGTLEFGFHTRFFDTDGGSADNYFTNMGIGFSPIRDLEIGVQKAVDSRRKKEDADPDPTVNFKVRLPPMGKDFSETAIGMLFDTNPNNYHTLYFTISGVGVGWNFGGNQGSGVANYGSYDKAAEKPKDVFIMIGTEVTPGKPGERGYRSHYYIDYNGDFFSAAWRFKSHRGFWAELGVQGKSSYSEFYDYKPVFAGIGGIF
ncbi:MAG: hypothetical protein HQM10_23040 [Candidatus Riflebacteria bacterium]|nr:hypothetical protein [Candidatus Riflebacteria bacterium]